MTRSPAHSDDLHDEKRRLKENDIICQITTKITNVNLISDARQQLKHTLPGSEVVHPLHIKKKQKIPIAGVWDI